MINRRKVLQAGAAVMACAGAGIAVQAELPTWQCFTVPRPGSQVLTIMVPDASRESAFARLLADDPVWEHPEVKYVGSVQTDLKPKQGRFMGAISRADDHA